MEEVQIGKNEGLSPLSKKPYRLLRPDHQMFDEIRIRTIPRYKESELSGDEWRISATTEFLCKGKVMHSTGWSNVKNAAYALGGDLLRAQDNGRSEMEFEELHCDQEGCSIKPTKTYKIKYRYSRDGDKKDPHHGAEIRRFCDRHKTRGDCGLEDADENYVLVEKFDGNQE